MISDLLTSVDRFESDLRHLGAAGHDIVLFHILDPAELAFEFDSPALFEDMESGRDMYIDPSAAAKDYKRRLHRHLDTIKSICQGLGIDYHLFATDRPFDAALVEFLQHRTQRRKRIRHVRPRGARGTP